jgi:hypothetical protein
MFLISGHFLYQIALFIPDTMAGRELGMIYIDQKVFYLNKLPTFINPEILPPNPISNFFEKYEAVIILYMHFYGNYQLKVQLPYLL